MASLGFASRSQIQEIHKLGSTRNANRILRDLHEYVNSFRIEESIYYLNQAGIHLLGLDIKPLTKNLQVDHYLMRNDLFIYYKYPRDWRMEIKNKYLVRNDSGGVTSKTITPDACFTVNGVHYFAEIDNTQHMNVNQKKIEAYKEFVSSFKEQFKQTPTIVFYTNSENRKKTLDEWCDRAGLYYRVFTKKDLWRGLK